MTDGMLKSCSNSSNRCGICRFADALQKNRQHLSLNSIEESPEESASSCFEIHLQQCFAFGAITIISYLFTTINEKPETESKKILRYLPLCGCNAKKQAA